MHDPSQRRRSMAKACTWRVISVTITTTLVYLFTGNIQLSAEIGVIDSALKIFAYYYHERRWHRVQWGKELITKEIADDGRSETSP